MNITKTILALVGATLMTAGAYADDPSITLHRVQQRYPWNGLVDIDYTVAGVPEGLEGDYFVRFTFYNNVAKTSFVIDNMEDDSTLAFASNGTYRVTWRSGAMPVEKFLSRDVSLKADIVYDHGCNGARTPYRMIKYLIIDLSEGPNATSYPIETEYFDVADQDSANAKFNTAIYKTDKLVLRRILRGTFTMGSPDTEEGRMPTQNYNAETQHRVTLTQDYDIGIFEITEKQWANVMGAVPNNQRAIGDDIACAQISYQDARGTLDGINVSVLTRGKVDADSFLGKLRAKTGLDSLDLPTEAQWEKACRAGTTTAYHFGNFTFDDNATFVQYGWYGEGKTGTTHAVGQKLPNAWGLYDMTGNVWEWCRDRVTAPPNDNWGTAPVTNPLRTVSNGNITNRGGSYYENPYRMRSAARAGNCKVTTISSDVGIRLSRTLP